MPVKTRELELETFFDVNEIRILSADANYPVFQVRTTIFNALPNTLWAASDRGGVGVDPNPVAAADKASVDRWKKSNHV